MNRCNSLAEFWIALPMTLAAVGALVQTIRNGRKADIIATNVDGHLHSLAAKNEAYESVIDDLSARLEDQPPR